jgi:uncharacterized protein (DUF885 family)
MAGSEVARVAGAAIVGLAEELARAHLGDDPFIASYFGVGGFDDAVPDLSPSARQAWRDRLVSVLVRCEGLVAEAEDLDSRVVLAAVRDHAIRGLAWADARVQEFSVTTLPFNGMFGPAMMLLVAARASITDAAGAAGFLTRCRRFPSYVEQYGARLQTAAAEGLLPVAPLVQGVINQLRGHLAHPERDPLLGHQSPQGWDGAASWREELEGVVRDEIRPALGRYLELLVELLPRSRPPERAGLLWVPGGVAAYGACIRNGTTLALDAEELHRLGLTALAEVEERIADLGSRALGARDAGEVLARLRQDPALQATDGRGAMAAAAAAIARAEARLGDIFDPPLPPPCTIAAMPQYLAASGAPPLYSPPTRDGSRPGAYLFNQLQPGAAGSWALEACAFHEAVPGHHAQYARLQLAADLPLLVAVFPVVAHGEGWGLYAEQLADELGLYSDDLQRLGMLALAALRAVRLVVDTGLHARGWSRTQALGFALAHTPLPESFMAAEIDRYIAAPGQALGYLVGQRELLRLREHARARLGAAFDLREFHAAVLDHGSLALPVLSQLVQAWITSAAPA